MLGVIIGGVFVWILAASTINSNNTGIMRMMGVRSNIQNNTQNSYVIDARFIKQMILHHEDAITMAEIALDKAQHLEVINLTENIITTQTDEIDQMRKWYSDWGY